jgi:hypothetical protein
MVSFQLGLMVLEDEKELLVLNFAKREIASVLDKQTEVVEQLAEADIRRKLAKFSETLEEFLLRWGNHGIRSPIERSPA